MDEKIVKIAQEFKETNAYVLEGYLDMCQADLPRKKRCWLEVVLDSNSYTDGRQVHLGLFTLTDVYEFVTARYPETDPEAVFALLNEYLLGHENQHTRSTRNKDWVAAQMKVYQTILSEISGILGDGKVFRKPQDYDTYVEMLAGKGYDISKGLLESTAHYVANSLEDGRIERIRSVKRPGFGKIMRFVRAALYEMHSAEDHLREGTYTPDTIPKKDALDILLFQLLSLATASVYEKDFFSLFADSEIGKDAHRMIPYIRSGVNSGCCRGIVAASAEIARIIAPYLLEASKNHSASDQIEAAKERMAQTGSGSEDEQHTTVANEEETDDGQQSSVLSSDDGESLNDNEASSQEATGSGSSSSAAKSAKCSNGPSDKAPQNGESCCQNTSGENLKTDTGVEERSEIHNTEASKGGRIDNFQEREASGMQADRENEVYKALDEAMKDAAAQMSGLSNQISSFKAEAKKKAGAVKETRLPEFKPLSTKTVFPGVKFKEVYRKYKPDTPMPYDLQVRADRFANNIEELFHNQEIPEIRCLNNGRIDPAGIYKLGLNMIDCFEQEKESPEFSGCAYFLCDNSGSMGYGKGTKRYFANTALAVIEQGFTKHMPIKMVAFDEASGAIIHEVIKNWDEDLPVSGAYNFAIKGRGGSGNADAYSIRVATEELLARPEEERMLVVLSDGAPACVTYTGKLTAEEEVKMAVEDARAAGIRVISIFFDEYRDDSIINAFHFMYEKQNSIICDPEEIEDELAALMQTFVFG